MRLYLYFTFNITLLFFLSAILDSGLILELATRLKYDDLANFLKQEPILSHIFLLAVSSLISVIILAFYEGYQWSKIWLITKKGITIYQLVHLTLFFFLPILFFALYLGQPWPILAKVYEYQFSCLLLFIERLSYDSKVMIAVVMMGFLPVISVIVGRQVREKPAKELWESLVGLVFVISLALRLDHLILITLDASLVKNLLVALVNLGILVTIPLGTLPIRMFPVTIINKFDDIPEIQDPEIQAIQRRAQRIFRDRIPSRTGQGPVMFPEPAVSLPELNASQQAGRVNPGLGDQSLLDDFSPPPQREKDYIESQLSINLPASRSQDSLPLPPETGSTAPLRLAVEDMSRRMKRSGLSLYELNGGGNQTSPTFVEIKKPEPWDIWKQLTRSWGLLMTGEAVKKELEMIEELVKYRQNNNINLRHAWRDQMEQIQRDNGLITDVYLTVQLLGRFPENVSSLSEQVKQLITELPNSPNLLHDILFRERLNNVTDIIFYRGQGSLAHPFETPLHAVKLFPLNDMRYARWLLELRNSEWFQELRSLEGETFSRESKIFQLPKKLVSSDIMVERGYYMAPSVVDCQWGPQKQGETVNKILTILNDCPKLEQDANLTQSRIWRKQLNTYFENNLPEEKKWIQTFLKYECAVLEKSQSKEYVEILNEFQRKQLESINDRRGKRILLLALLEKGMGYLRDDVSQNRDVKLVPALKEIVNELRSSQTGTAMDLSTP
jgi:hypothetical protein